MNTRSKAYEAKIVKKECATSPFNEVHIQTSAEEAGRLFHDVNRLLSLLDHTERELDPGDQRAYDRVNGLLAQLQSELSIDPDDAPEETDVHHSGQ